MEISTKATSLGVVYNRASGKIVRVFNPDFEEELDLHPVADGEFMLRVDKVSRGISGGMTLDEVHSLVEAMS